MCTECKFNPTKTMIDKPKPKREEPTLWDKLSDLVLLAMPFERELDISPEECAEKLKTLSHPKPWFINRIHTAVEITQISDSICDFELRTEREQNEVYLYTTSIMKGVIFRDEAIEKTVIRGKMRLESSFAPLGIGIVVLAFVGLVLPDIIPVFCVPFVIVGFLFVINFTRSVMDSSSLYNRMFDLFPKADKLKKKPAAQ